MKHPNKQRANNTLKILDYLQANVPDSVTGEEDEDEDDKPRKQHMSKLSRKPSSNSPF
jgi:hypothetical protein